MLMRALNKSHSDPTLILPSYLLFGETFVGVCAWPKLISLWSYSDSSSLSAIWWNICWCLWMTYSPDTTLILPSYLLFGETFSFIILLWSNPDPTLIQPWSKLVPSLIQAWSIHDPSLIHPWSKLDPSLIQPLSIPDPTLIHRWSMLDPNLILPSYLLLRETFFGAFACPKLIPLWSCSDSAMLSAVRWNICWCIWMTQVDLAPPYLQLAETFSFHNSTQI